MQIKVKEMMNPPSKQVEERLKMQLVFFNLIVIGT